ncbi:ABC1 kinase family protein [Rhodohalobacter sp. 614A]|uniref:ABC1 kinase family protein n=1 Tax=Rhodohalobacter sp. 614A TaxID=2908649 RepID=UPI001F458D3D
MALKNLGQYKDLAFFLWKYGNSNFIEQAKIQEIASEEWNEQKQISGDVLPSQMVEDLKEMGPAFIKLGQLLSTRPDLLPPPYIRELSNLQDQVEPFSYEQVEEIIQSELGVKISKAFKHFEKKPIASASLGQVHIAELRNGGMVAVKVQRPGIRKRISEDLEVLENTCEFLEKNTDFGKRYGLNKLFQQFKKTLIHELDYLKEAKNLRIFEKNLSEFRRIVIPEPVEDYSTDRVLTMQYLKGRKITEISPLQQLELDGDEIADELFRAYLKQIVIDGFVHADPHPGNIHLMNDNRVAMLDCGMVAHVSPEIRNQYLKLVLNIGDGSAGEAVDKLITMSEELENADEVQFRKSVSSLILDNMNSTASELQTGKIILDIVKVAGKSGYLLPVEMSMIGKALLNLDQVARILSPEFNPNEAIRKHAMELTNKHLWKDLTSLNFFPTVLESKELIEKMPERLNKFLRNVAENKVQFKIDALDEERLMMGFQKVANRITVGLILAALIVGSSLLMQVQTEFTLFGYPGLAMIFFLVAVLGSGMLAFRIFVSDKNE